MRTQSLIITLNNSKITLKTYHKITINTLTSSSVTRLEEALSISSDLLFKREYKTRRISGLLYIINSQILINWIYWWKWSSCRSQID